MPLPDLNPKLRDELVIRPYFQSDYDHAYRIIRAIGEQKLGRNLRLWDEIFVSPTGYIWTALIGGRPVGFGCMDCYEEGTMTLHTDVVDPEYQRQGIGTALVLARLNTLDPAHFSQAILLATEHSRAFYERFGFEAEGMATYDPMADYTVQSMLLPFDDDVAMQIENTLSRMPVDIHLEESEPDPPSP